MSVSVEQVVPKFLDLIVDSKLVEGAKEKLNWTVEEVPFDKHVSQIFRLVVKQPKGDRSFIIKVPENGTLFQVFNPTNAYEREIYTYKKIFPLMNKALSCADDYLAPRFLGTQGLATLTDDLGQKGYKMPLVTEVLDKQALSKALEKLAIFHAASIKIQEKNPELLERFRTYYFPATDVVPPDQFPVKLERAARIYVADFDAKYGDQLKKFSSVYLDQISVDMDWKKSPINVLTHGHFLFSNVMVQREPGGQVKDAVFTGFNFQNLMSPVCDIMYLLMTSNTYDVYKQHGHELLDHYCTTLGKTLVKLQCDRKLNLKAQDFKSMFEEKTSFGLFVVTLVLPFFRAQDPAKCADPDNQDSINSPIYGNVAKSWIKFLIEEKKALSRVISK